MVWIALIAAAVSLVASYALRPKLQTPLSPTPEDPKYPKCEEGGVIPVVFGTVQIDRPQLLWMSQATTTPIKGIDGLTTGYAYHAGLSLGLCRGKIDGMVGLIVDGHSAPLSYINRENAVYPIKKHFSSEQRFDRGYWHEYKGYLTFGDAGPGINTDGFDGVDYLINPEISSVSAQYDGKAPGLFGIAVMEFETAYLGQSPYPITISARVQRINYSLNGWSTQWYPEKAAIPSGRDAEETWSFFATPGTDVTTYEDPLYDVSTWDTGGGGFGNTTISGAPATVTATPTPDDGDLLWIRHTIGPLESHRLAVKIWHTSTASGDTVSAWWNGSPITLYAIRPTCSYGYVETEINRNGNNVVAVRITQNADAGLSYGAVEVTARDTEIDQEDAGWSSENSISMNPAHMIREIWLDAQDGMGYLEADIDDDALEAVADTLYNERFGMCFLWDKSVQAGEFIEEILRYINGRVYVNRTTGKFTLRLVRQDYSTDDLLVLDDDNTVSVEDVTRRATGDLVNAIRVEYTNSLAGDIGTVTVHDPSLIQTQGQLYSLTMKYPAITSFDLASRVALRDLQIASKPLWVCKATTNREAANLYIGDPVILHKPTIGFDEVVMRVTGVDLGDGISNRVVLSLIEDAFTSPIYSTISQTNQRWTNPSAEAPPASTVLVYDAPYWELKRNLGLSVDTFIDMETNNANGQVLVAASQPIGALNASLYTKTGANDYAFIGQMDFCPSMQISQEILISDTVIHYTNEINLGSIVVGNIAIIGSNTDGEREIIRIDAIDTGLKTLTVGRGCLDTVPVAHPVSGTVIMYTGNFVARDTSPRSMGVYPAFDADIVDVKVCPRNSSGEASLAEAPVYSVDLEANYDYGDDYFRRAYRPYPPGNVKVNGVQFLEELPATGDIVFTWSSRDKSDPYVRDFTVTDIPTSSIDWLDLYDDHEIDFAGVKGPASNTYTLTNAAEIAARNNAELGRIDANFASVSCLLHCDGADKSKNLFDSGPLGINFSMLGTAEITTASSKYGGASFNPGTKGATTWTTTPFQFGSGDFTIEAWVYVTGGIISDWSVIASHNVGDSGSGVVSWMLVMTELGQVRFYWSTNGSSWNGGSVRQTSSGLTPGIWHHIAFVRSGTVGTLYVNGSYTGPGGVLWQTGGFDQPASITGTLYAATAPVNIGIDGNGTRPFHGYIDDVRITKGVARTILTPAWMTDPFPPGSQGLSTSLRMELRSYVTDGDNDIQSFTRHNWTMYRFGYGVGYGKSYGGTT